MQNHYIYSTKAYYAPNLPAGCDLKRYTPAADRIKSGRLRGLAIVLKKLVNEPARALAKQYPAVRSGDLIFEAESILDEWLVEGPQGNQPRFPRVGLKPRFFPRFANWDTQQVVFTLWRRIRAHRTGKRRAAILPPSLVKAVHVYIANRAALIQKSSKQPKRVLDTRGWEPPTPPVAPALPVIPVVEIVPAAPTFGTWDSLADRIAGMVAASACRLTGRLDAASQATAQRAALVALGDWSAARHRFARVDVMAALARRIARATAAGVAASTFLPASLLDAMRKACVRALTMRPRAVVVPFPVTAQPHAVAA